jgi:NADP-dependent 3-hydroxy acid dehydrogenase YdfG
MPKALERIAFNANASYLLSGGLGGLGRSISRWMVSNGARNLIYVARHGASSPEASTLIRDLNSAGVRTEVIECDVTDSVRLSDSLSKSLKTMPPIHGVIQGAMVLQDQIFSNMTFEAFTSCIRPKVQGSWALHQATIQQPLDFFVLLSSCASFWGNAGQTNYAAGCTYQGTLATHRQSLGLPASSIDIGKVANVGFVAENAGTTSEMNLLKLGLLDISENELLAMLELAMLPAKHDDKAPGKGGNMPNGHLLTGLSSSNDISKGDELPFWSRDPVFSHMSFVRPHLRKAKENLDTSSTTQKQQPLPILLSAAGSAEEAEESVLGALMQKLTRSLMMRLEEIDAQKPMAAYGVDSLVAVELRNWFSREAKVDLAVFDIVQAKSLIGLAKKVAAKSSLVKLQV